VRDKESGTRGEAIMKLVLLIVGVLILLLGLHWIGQGTAYFPWPRNPVMDGQIEWAYYGVGTVAVGLVIIWISRRKSN
jgi:hypothetical protein